jgi:hypothetical protein
MPLPLGIPTQVLTVTPTVAGAYNLNSSLTLNVGLGDTVSCTVVGGTGQISKVGPFVGLTAVTAVTIPVTDHINATGAPVPIDCTSTLGTSTYSNGEVNTVNATP